MADASGETAPQRCVKKSEIGKIGKNNKLSKETKDMRGRRPKSTIIKLLTGNPGGRKLNKNEPKYPKLDVTPPHFLDALALEEWNRICSELHATGMLTTADRATFAAY